MTNVLLVTDWNGELKFAELARELQNFGIRAKIMHDVAPAVKHRLWSLGMETKVISMFPLKNFLPDWAEIWQHKNYTKIEEYNILEAAGMPVPKWVPVYEGQNPDLSGFSEYVVVKPALGWRGAFVRIMRRTKVTYRPLETEVMPGVVSPALIAQEFIPTGTWPISYRVTTMFGEPIFTFRSMADMNWLPFVGSTSDSNFFVGKSIVATAKGCSRDSDVPEDIIKLASEAHRRAFPDIPLLGFDIVRDIRTGKLFVLEVNAFGRTYLLGEEESQQNLEEFGFDLHQQFGGIKAVARGIYQRLTGKTKEEQLVHECVA